MFFRFCADAGWIKKNPVASLKAPKVDTPQVLPFADGDVTKILKACNTHPMPTRGKQLKALALLMLHTGLRIGDAATLSVERIHKRDLKLRTTKSGTDVEIPLHADVLSALRNVPTTNGYYFWDGESNRISLVKLWDAAFLRLFKRAGIVGGHPHRFRHTLAARMLQKGVSINSVAALLGHRRTAITEKHYSAWIPERQELLKKEVRNAWS